MAEEEDAASPLVRDVLPSCDLDSRSWIIGSMFDSDGVCVPFSGESKRIYAYPVGNRSLLSVD